MESLLSFIIESCILEENQIYSTDTGKRNRSVRRQKKEEEKNDEVESDTAIGKNDS